MLGATSLPRIAPIISPAVAAEVADAGESTESTGAGVTDNGRRLFLERAQSYCRIIYFPKGHLKSLGITELRDTNQIANYAFVEWGDNASIADHAPANYLPTMKGHCTAKDLERMYYCHALPDNWEAMTLHRLVCDVSGSLPEPGEFPGRPLVGTPQSHRTFATHRAV